MGVIKSPTDRTARDRMLDESVDATLPMFDVVMREFASQRNLEMVRRSSGLCPTSLHPSEPDEARLVPLWYEHMRQLNGELLDRGSAIYSRHILEALLSRAEIIDPKVTEYLAERRRIRAEGIANLAAVAARGPDRLSSSEGHHHHSAEPLVLSPQPVLDSLEESLTSQFSSWLILWPARRHELVGFGGELDRAVSMPGWTNVWTMPIQNRVDMLATGVNSPVGIRVMGRDFEQVVRASEQVAAAIKNLPGAADVVADPVRGKPYLEIRFDRARAAHLGVNVGEANKVIETAMAGKVATFTAEGRERHPVVVRYQSSRRQDEDAVRSLLVPASSDSTGRISQVHLGEFAEVRVVEGPASIKGENGFLRNYVRVNVRGRDAASFVDEARQVVSRSVTLPSGIFLEWTGQFEHEVRSRRTLMVVVPIVISLIFLLLYWMYRDLADATLMMMAVPGAVAGGLFFQWFLGFDLSVTVWVGYIACFGMATSTGIIMLVYLREAVERAGGLDNMGLDDLRRAVLDGAAHRLRPKLLTEGTVIIGLAPMLWADGVASEVIRPMAAPVMGGILVADEVIDLLLPVLFYWVRRMRWYRHHPHFVSSQSDVDLPISRDSLQLMEPG
jgi:Cu(I)/Ag(I) efflux system membrane protein CusA/SilA